MELGQGHLWMSGLPSPRLPTPAQSWGPMRISAQIWPDHWSPGCVQLDNIQVPVDVPAASSWILTDDQQRTDNETSAVGPGHPQAPTTLQNSKGVMRGGAGVSRHQVDHWACSSRWACLIRCADSWEQRPFQGRAGKTLGEICTLEAWFFPKEVLYTYRKMLGHKFPGLQHSIMRFDFRHGFQPSPHSSPMHFLPTPQEVTILIAAF